MPLVTESVPLAVWPAAQTSAQYQRAGRYLPDSTAHPGKMLPALARRIVETYSDTGHLVLDPMCGVGTTLIEAADLGRCAIGLEIEPRWADLASANAAHVLGDRAGRVEVRVGDARRLTDDLADVADRVDLVVTSPPYACEVGTINKPAWLAGASMCDRDSLNYSESPTNLGRARGEQYLEAMAGVYAGCYDLLRPGGLLVTVTKNLRRAGRCFDLAGATVDLATSAGFRYHQHVIALLCALRGEGLVARPSFWQLSHTRRARAAGQPAHLVVHEDVLVFIKGAARG